MNSIPAFAAPVVVTAPRRRVSLGDITAKSRRLPLRIIYHAVPGFGKTSFAAQFPNPVFLCDASETGLETLIDSGQLGETPHFPPIETWQEVLDAVTALTEDEHSFKTLAIDTMGGIERLCHEHVCRRDYGGDWGDKGFSSYHKGYDVSLADWRELLQRLDTLRERRNVRIVMLAHTRVTQFRNPEGEDYDRFEPDTHRKTWALTHKWADLVLFGNYITAIDKKPGQQKGKGRGGTQRMLYTERSAAWDAKHRHGLEPQILLGDSPTEAYQSFLEAMKAGHKAASNGHQATTDTGKDQ